MRVHSGFIRLVLVALIAATFAGSAAAQASLQENRNRLLDGYAARIGATSRCDAWSRMTETQKGVFLTITDMLGERAYLYEPLYRYKAYSSECNNWQDSECPGGFCSVPAGWNYCVDVTTDECVASGACYRTPVPRSEISGSYSDTMLDHVTRLWAVRDGDGNCGGSGNRIFFSADDALMYQIRQRWIPAIRESNDPMPPHAPFTASHETHIGQPRGQIHFWEWDYRAQTLWGDGVDGVFDPHAVEIDIDYNLIHDSNPQCSYGGTLGRYKYEQKWRWEGRGAPTAELGYNPCSTYNSIDDALQFTRQQYYDLLKREPDFSGWNFWADRIRNCGSDAGCVTNQRIHVSRAFWFSGDFQSRYDVQTSGLVVAPGTVHPFDPRQFVRWCYLVYLKREPDQSGWDFWTDELNRDLMNDPNDSGYNHVIDAFLQSSDYRRRFGHT